MAGLQVGVGVDIACLTKYNSKSADIFKILKDGFGHGIRVGI